MAEWVPQERLLAKGMDVLPSLGDHLAHRVLKGAGMWPAPGPGRRRARPSDYHRSCWTLSAAGDTRDLTIAPTRAPEYVPAWRSLVLENSEITRVSRVMEQAPPGERATVVVERSERMLPTANADPDDLAALLFADVVTLGDFLDMLQPRLVRLAEPYGGLRADPPGFGDEMRLTLISGPNYRAVFEAVPPFGRGSAPRSYVPICSVRYSPMPHQRQGRQPWGQPICACLPGYPRRWRSRRRKSIPGRRPPLSRKTRRSRRFQPPRPPTSLRNRHRPELNIGKLVLLDVVAQAPRRSPNRRLFPCCNRQEDACSMPDKNDACPREPEWLALAIAAPEARKLLGAEPDERLPTYRKLYRAVLDGRLEHRRVNGRVEIYRPSLVSFISA